MTKEEIIKKLSWIQIQVLGNMDGVEMSNIISETIGDIKEELANQKPALSADREEVTSVLYQKCPLCDGVGRILADGFTSSVYQQCTACSGAKIIPMFTQQPKQVSDDEIYKASRTINIHDVVIGENINYAVTEAVREGFKLGAKWMRDKLTK